MPPELSAFEIAQADHVAAIIMKRLREGIDSTFKLVDEGMMKDGVGEPGKLTAALIMEVFLLNNHVMRAMEDLKAFSGMKPGA